MMSAGDTSGLGGRGGLNTLDGSESTTLPLQVCFTTRRHAPFSPHVATRFPHVSEIYPLFFVFF